MKVNASMSCRLAGLAVWALGSCMAHAQDADPPSRAARLSYVQGSVSFQPAGVQEWAAAVINRPLTTGDRLWSDADSRAELDVGSVVMRLDSMSGFSLLNLDDTVAQMQLTAGTLIVRVREMRAGENYEIDTPNVAVTLQQPGEYRVEVNDAGDTTVVKVSEGSALAQGGGQQVQVEAQQRFTFAGTTETAADGTTLGAPDELDAWSAARERQVEDSASRQYVADEVAGTQDLDDNGQWQQTPQYGYVWTPTAVVAGWAPYRFGQWAWVAPWGWTWVDDARWGYAPFHYGRWVSLNNAWCWVPGPRIVRPVYAPALVGWVAGPAGGPLLVGGSHVGWFPLGPREVYVPAYRVSPAYARGVNLSSTVVVNNTYVTNVYANGAVNPHYMNNTAAAVTAVPQDVFASGQRLAGHIQRVPPALLTGAVAGAVVPAVVPARNSVLGSSANRPRPPPPAVMNRPVLARTPLPRAPVSFELQVGAIEANGGRPLGHADLVRLQPAAAMVPVRMVAAAPARPTVAASGAGAGSAEHSRTPQDPRATALTHSTLPAPAAASPSGRTPGGAAAPIATPRVQGYEHPAQPVSRSATTMPGQPHQAGPAAPSVPSPAYTVHPQAETPHSQPPAAVREPSIRPPQVSRPPAPPSPAKPSPQPQQHEVQR